MELNRASPPKALIMAAQSPEKPTGAILEEVVAEGFPSIDGPGVEYALNRVIEVSPDSPMYDEDYDGFQTDTDLLWRDVPSLQTSALKGWMCDHEADLKDWAERAEAIADRFTAAEARDLLAVDGIEFLLRTLRILEDWRGDGGW